MKTDSGTWSDGPHGLLRQINNPTRLRGAYIERYKDIVFVCIDTPCITKEDKDKIDAMLNPIEQQIDQETEKEPNVIPTIPPPADPDEPVLK